MISITADERGTTERVDRQLAYLVRRLGFLALAKVSPGLAAKWALRLFATPLRPISPIDPSPPGLRGHRFAVPFRSQRAGLVQLAAWAWGQGPTVVLSHGWSGHAGHMTAFIPPLVAAGFRVINFDHPAHGSSEGARTNMLEFRDALLTIVQQAGAVKKDGAPGVTALVGHSLGATATVLALDRGLAIERAVLIEPPLDPTRYAHPFGQALGVPTPVTNTMLEGLRVFVDADLQGRNSVAVAREQKLPALIIHDRDDRAVPLAEGEALANAWPGSRLLVTQGLGHKRILGDAGVIAAVTRFVSGTE